jgi:N-(2-amino-2-carboxyethyl)-L-glutamate synthase
VRGRRRVLSVESGILSTIGRTPLVRLARYFAPSRFEVAAKLESFNPGGSSKDRPALGILAGALHSGAIRSDTVVIESSSGNMGIGLAQACRYHRLRFICVVDPKASPLNLGILKAFGAEVDLVSAPDPVTGEWLPARLDRVQALLREIPNSYWPNQYGNPANAAAHYQTTIAEVVAQVGDTVDLLFIPTSTCGTIRGCGEYVRDNGLRTRIVAVDAAGSLIFGAATQAGARRLIPGLGAGIRPLLCDPGLIARVVHVTDMECVAACRRLVEQEAILAGGSSGATLAAIEKLAAWIPAGSRCVAILPDRGERYLDTIYNDRWVADHLGEPAMEGTHAGGVPCATPVAALP